MEKATLVLEGGATRGVFTSGVLDYLMEKDLYMSHVIGVSAGSCNGVDYVSKQIGRTKECMIYDDDEFDYYFGVRKFVKEKSVLNMDLIFDRFPNEIYPFDYDTYFQSEIKTEWVVTNCETGKPEYMDDKKEKEKLMKICRASCSMPLLSPIVKIDGTPYLDGGIEDSIPLKRELTYGNKKIVIISTKDRGYRKKLVTRGQRKIYERAYKKYPNLVKTIMYRPFHYNAVISHIEKLEDEGKVFVIRPEIPLISRLERDTAKLTKFYEHGYEQGEKYFEDLQNYLKCR